MSPLSKLFLSAPMGALLAMSAVATLLGGCTAQVRVAAPPPPPRVYVAPPPPPPAYEEPAAEVRIAEAPPPLPEYEQPACPVEGYLWAPGYWAYGGGGYYWVPGTWVQPPRVGVLWTPGYWGFVSGVYVFHGGYWGPHIGYYGGVHYGYGYTGVGFAGGRWVGNSFSYNQQVTNVNVTVVHNTYNETVINNNITVNRVSYNGGAGGVVAAPTPQERLATQEQHIPPTQLQRQHVQQASANPALLARSNGGRPAIAATPRPAAFNEPGVVGAHGATPVALGHGGQPGHPPTAGQPYGHAPGAGPAPGSHPAGAAQPYGAAHPAHPPGTNGNPANVNGAKAPKQHPKESPEGQHREPETAAK